ncbi:D-aminoacyl-tRNA deacylase 2-like, partial [Homarus americanus]
MKRHKNEAEYTGDIIRHQEAQSKHQNTAGDESAHRGIALTRHSDIITGARQTRKVIQHGAEDTEIMKGRRQRGTVMSTEAWQATGDDRKGDNTMTEAMQQTARQAQRHNRLAEASEKSVKKLVKHIANARLSQDDTGRKVSACDIQGDTLIIPQSTLG